MSKIESERMHTSRPFFGLTMVAAATVAIGSSDAVAQSAKQAPPGNLSLHDAIELGLARDPGVVSAKQTRDRSQLAVTRAQLDRFSLRVDAFVNEQYRVSNLGGSAPTPSCSTVPRLRWPRSAGPGASRRRRGCGMCISVTCAIRRAVAPTVPAAAGP